jgi:hypothetical protein
MDEYTVNCVHSLLLLITADTEVAQFFSELPGPTYCLARYTDWFRPYLEKQLADAKKGYSGSYSTQKEETIVKCLSLMEQYEAFLNSKDGNKQVKNEGFIIKTTSEFISAAEVQPLLTDDMDIDQEESLEENVRNLISDLKEVHGDTAIVTHHENVQPINKEQTVIRANPQPYIIVDCVSERIVSQQDFGNVILQISALGCFYTESLPTGDSNLAIPSNLFRRATSKAISSLPLRNIGAVKSTEQELQTNCINNYFQSSSMGEKQAPRGGNTTPKKQYEGGFQYPEGEECIENNEDAGAARSIIIKDDDSQWEKINSQNLGALDSDMYADDREQDEENVNRGEPTIKIKVIEEGDTDTNMTSGQVQDQQMVSNYDSKVDEANVIEENEQA